MLKYLHMWIIVLQRISIEFFWHLIYFPIWWYSVGLKKSFAFALDWFKMGNTYLAPGLWLKNIFVPMYGQRDFQGRLTSFFIRFVNVIIRGLGLLFWLVLSILVFMVWPALPVVFFYMFFISLF